MTLAPPQPGLGQMASCWTEIYLAGSEAFLWSGLFCFAVSSCNSLLSPSSHWTVPPSGFSTLCHLPACLSLSPSPWSPLLTCFLSSGFSDSSPHLPDSPYLLALHSRLKSLLPWPHNPPRPGTQVSHLAAGLVTTFLLMPLNLSQPS